MRILISLSSKVTEQAVKLGLHHIGFGWYTDKKESVHYKSVDGKLKKVVKVQKKKSGLFKRATDFVRNWGKTEQDKKYTGYSTQFGKFSNSESHAKSFVKWAKKFKTNLSSKEKDSLKKYKGKSYEAINKYLRKTNEVLGLTHSSEELKEMVSNIDSALKKSKLSEDVSVYRGTELPEKYSGDNVQDLVGRSINDDAYTSVSTNPRMAGYFCRNKKTKRTAVIKMTLPKGSSALPLTKDTVGGNGGTDNECELICPRSMKIVVHKVEEVKDPKDWPPALIIHAIPVYE